MRAISRRVKWRAELEVRKKPAGEKIRAVCRVYLARLRVKDLERKLLEEDEAAASKLVEHLRGEFARHDGDRSGTLTHAELTALIQARYEVRHQPPRLAPAQPTIRSKSPHGRKDSLKPAPVCPCGASVGGGPAAASEGCPKGSRRDDRRIRRLKGRGVG